MPISCNEILNGGCCLILHDFGNNYYLLLKQFHHPNDEPDS